ncbi:unnamed protein product [Notodromas monacha]|uniref:Uncharacterized protein n=1 Tax=Notodromas monacha TaxID=399045 RepID=A0A7R9BEV2_9CRUS|nr:unnamed protein product [Notodromas monacha]CAG0913206.1 unnamed protein product [Notodromas monacha]
MYRTLTSCRIPVRKSIRFLALSNRWAMGTDEEDETSEKKSAKDALLLWCQRRTTGYPHVEIHDFTGSWVSGMGFNALIHAHRPDLIDFQRLHPDNHLDNLNYAFNVAERELNIPRLLDAEDIDTIKPDEKSVITYVASYYHCFAKMKNEIKGGRRIANIVGQLMDIDQMKSTYDDFTRELLRWIQQKIVELDRREFKNSLEGIRQDLAQFKKYRTVEKPPKYKDWSEIEALFFGINMKLSSLNQPPYVAPDGQSVHDIQSAWEKLERAEHRLEVSLRDEWMRQERLENLAQKFLRKAVVRENYLKEMNQVLSDPRYGCNVSQIDATVKKHEAISADILARRERLHELADMAVELDRENYRGKEEIKKRSREIMEKWQELLKLLEKLKVTLATLSNLMSLLREAETVTASVKDLEDAFKSEDVGIHLMDVEDLLQKHAIQEAEVNSVGDTIKKLNKQAQTLLLADYKESPLLDKKLQKLNDEYANVLAVKDKRRALLEEARNFFSFLQNHEDEEAWIIEKQRICQAALIAKDLRAVMMMQQKHKALEDEVRARKGKIRNIYSEGEDLIKCNHCASDDIRARLQELDDQCKALDELTAKKRLQIQQAIEGYQLTIVESSSLILANGRMFGTVGNPLTACHNALRVLRQFYADVNEAESWMKEKLPLVKSADFGTDEPSAQALLARQKVLEGEIQAYRGDVQSLNAQGEKLIKAGNAILTLSQDDSGLGEDEPQEEWVTETRLVPQEIWVDEPVKVTELTTVTETVTVNQVRALYAYDGHGMKQAKGEIMVLLKKTNDDWWNVRKQNGQDGFVPASYVKEIDPKIIPVKKRKPETVVKIQKVKRTKMVEKQVKVKRPKPPIRGVKPKQKQAAVRADVDSCLKELNKNYDDLVKFAQDRRAFLEDSVHLFKFYQECDDLEKWMKDQERLLRATPNDETVADAKMKFEASLKFVTDMSAATHRLEELDNAAADLEREGNTQMDKIRRRQKQIHAMWKRMNQLKEEKEKSLEGATSVELFGRTCDEACDWMREKMMKMDTDDLGPDLKTVQALQRKHTNLERELAPVEQKVERILSIGSVINSYPMERASVLSRQKQLQDLWKSVKTKAQERRARLEDAVGEAVFTRSSKNLLRWVAAIKEALNADETANDLATAEALLKKHADLGEEIKGQESEFKTVKDHGRKLLSRKPSSREAVEKALVELEEEENAVRRGWQEKEDWLRQRRDLQVFEREADHLDSATSAHEAFLAFQDLGESVDAVEALLKRHDEFENMLIVQDERLKGFVIMSDELLEAQHAASQYILERRNAVVARRQAVKEKASERRNKLLASRDYQALMADADDMSSWMNDKLKLASDESYRDLSNLERKLQKQEAFVRELHANEGRLKGLRKAAQGLVNCQHYRSPEIEEAIEKLNAMWDNLWSKTNDRKKKLRQANAQHEFNKTLEDAKEKLDDLEKKLISTDVGSDLRSCKQLLYAHQGIENDMEQWQMKIRDMIDSGKDMAHDGHFDGDAILQASGSFQKKLVSSISSHTLTYRPVSSDRHFYNFELKIPRRYDRLKAPILLRREALEKALAYYEFAFEVDAQLQWIADKLPMVKSEAVGQSLHEAQSLDKKHKKLMDELNGHEKSIDKIITEGQGLIKSNHPHAAQALELELDTYNGIVNEMGSIAQGMLKSQHPEGKIIEDRHQMVSQQVKNLQKLANSRRQNLLESLYRHEYLRESDDLEQWINECIQISSSEDYGKDWEHLETLSSKFSDFKHRVNAGAERVMACRDLAKKLIGSDSPYSNDIEKRQEQLDAIWEKLNENIEIRDERFVVASDIHQFNKDVAEALERIQEKKGSVPDDVGRDLHSVESLLKKHDGFENDLVALETKLQLLVNDAAKLRDMYPGEHADTIAEQQTAVVNAWESLQLSAAERKERLTASLEFHRFMSASRDLLNWAESLRGTMMAEEKVHDAASSQMDIKRRKEKLLDERQKLHATWHHKKVYLDQLIDLHFFLRDAKQLSTIAQTQEVALNATDAFYHDSADGSHRRDPLSIEQVDSALKKHEAFEKVVLAQDDKFSSLQMHGEKLVQQCHFDSPNISKKMEEVEVQRRKIKELTASKRYLLEQLLLNAQFNRDVEEAQIWIGEKLKSLESPELKAETVTSLEDKVKKLKKHQAVQAEIKSNEPRMKQIMENGDILLKNSVDGSTDVRRNLDQLRSAWKALLRLSRSLSKGFEEAQDILDFNSHVEKAESWIKEKELMVSAADTGRDYEHCLELQRKLDDVDSEVRVDDSRMKLISDLADKIVSRGHTNANQVLRKREDLNQKWKNLQGVLNKYRNGLASALEIHAFYRDVGETKSRIHEKMLALSVEDVGQDLLQVEALQRRQEALERDISVIGGRIKELDADARRLTKKYPDSVSSILQRLSDLQESWRALIDKSDVRKQALTASHTYHKFQSELNELERWSKNIREKMNSMSIPTSLAEAEANLQLHQERKAEIDGRQDSFKALKEFGHRLYQQSHRSKEQVEEKLNYLEEMRRELMAAWEEQKQILQQSKQLQEFICQADEAEEWLSSKEAFLINDDYGESMASVEALMRKHTDFEKALSAQQEAKIDQLERLATELAAAQHIDMDTIRERLQSVCHRHDQLKKNSLMRKQKLVESKQLQQFLSNVYEVAGWIGEKYQVASDDSYRDLTNLQHKLQKHVAFEAELIANEGRIHAVTEEGEKLIGANHYSAMEIQSRLSELEHLWRQLQDASMEKKAKLEAAYQAFAFTRSLDDLEAWMDEVESQLQSEDHGHDHTSTQFLIKKHQALETDYHHHAENTEKVNEQVKKFAVSGHFLIEMLEEKSRLTVDRYNSLQEPLQIRKENLEDASQLYQFTRDIDDEIMWVQEKEPICQSNDLGNSLRAAQKLLKKHQTTEGEIQSRESVIDRLCTKGEKMIKNGHVDAATIEKKCTELGARWTELKDAASLRRLRLQDALESHQFFEDAEEVEAWIAEKKRLVDSTDAGKDEDSVQLLQKKLDSLSHDIDNLKAPIGRLSKHCETMESRNHFDAARVRKQQKKLEDSYARLSSKLEEKLRRLEESAKLYKFLREAEEVSTWINDEMSVAASEDYGVDVEHVQVLIDKFQIFRAALNAGEERVLMAKATGEQLIEDRHNENETIRAKIKDVTQLWEDLNELAQARQDALLGAKQVHAFDRSADETIEWIQEKDAVISSETYGNDLESIQALMRKHHGFERDLAAVKEQVEAVDQEAHQLAAQFPDAREHISVKHEETVEAWNNLLEKSAQRKDKLQQAEELQAYFDEYRDLMYLLCVIPNVRIYRAWVNEMIAKVTAPELAKDLKAAEVLVTRHEEMKAEMDARSDALSKFSEAGEKIIRSGHFMSGEIQEKIQSLETRRKQLVSSWEKRQKIYDFHLDLLTFMADCTQMEGWLQSRQSQLSDSYMGSSIAQVEDLIKKHDDFEKTLTAHEQKLASVKRLTKDSQEPAAPPKADTESGSRSIWRPGSQTNLLQLPKRAESMRVGEDGGKKPKRTPSFTTRKRTTSFRKQKLKMPDEMVQLPPVEMKGFLERKQELQTGGKKATIRSWKTHYTVLCGQLLCFFKDMQDFVEGKASSPPVAIYNSTCEVATNYTKKKYVFRIVTTDGAEYLFKAENEVERDDWVKKTKFHASLPPSQQLLSYDSHKAGIEEHSVIEDSVFACSGEGTGGHSPGYIRKAPLDEAGNKLHSQRGSGLHEETLSSGSSRSNSPLPQPPNEAPPRSVHPPSPAKGQLNDAYLTPVPSPPPMHSHPYGREQVPVGSKHQNGREKILVDLQELPSYYNATSDGLGELRDFSRRPEPVYANEGAEQLHVNKRPQSFHGGPSVPPPPPPARTSVHYGATPLQGVRDIHGAPTQQYTGSSSGGVGGPGSRVSSLPPRTAPPSGPGPYPQRGQLPHASLTRSSTVAVPPHEKCLITPPKTHEPSGKQATTTTTTQFFRLSSIRARTKNVSERDDDDVPRPIIETRRAAGTPSFPEDVQTSKIESMSSLQSRGVRYEPWKAEVAKYCTITG